MSDSRGESPAAGNGDEQYQSLYRRYRPQRFADVLGQEHVTRALRNAVRDSRVSHAYLFSGPRGTGKTSTARIFAMALNCEHLVDGEPDGTCSSCQEIRRGSSVDVHELDAASNRKLDEMRELLARVALGTRGRWKVYIIDEVHQLTSDAASALLKTLEGPPAHVVFILATTDPQKVLPTIRSRTQPYEFRLLSSETLTGLLRQINTQAGLGIASEAIDLVVRRGHGSARDALSVLDQVAAAGAVDDEATVITDIVDALADHDGGAALMALAEGMVAGRDPRRLGADIVEQLRNGFLSLQARALVMLADDAAERAAEQARRLGLGAVVRAMEVIGQALAEMRDSVDPRITLEVALVRLANPAADASLAALLERVERLERAGPALAPVDGAVPAAAAVEERSEMLRSTLASAAAPEAATNGLVPTGPIPPEPATPIAGGEYSASTRPRAPSKAPPPVPRPAPGPAPALPSTGARPALGAHRKAAPAQGAPAAPKAPSAPLPDLASEETESEPVGRPVAGEAPSAPSPPPVAESAPSAPLPPPVAESAPSAPLPPPVADKGPGPTPLSAAAMAPSRDELTKAWGDSILAALPGRVKAYFSAGRFVDPPAGTSGAVFALPDRAGVARAAPVRADVEEVLTRHFGYPVGIELILDGQASPVGMPDVGSDEVYDLDDLDDVDTTALTEAGPELSSPEQRLFEAFPGAEEVTP